MKSLFNLVTSLLALTFSLPALSEIITDPNDPDVASGRFARVVNIEKLEMTHFISGSGSVRSPDVSIQNAESYVDFKLIRKVNYSETLGQMTAFAFGLGKQQFHSSLSLQLRGWRAYQVLRATVISPDGFETQHAQNCRYTHDASKAHCDLYIGNHQYMKTVSEQIQNIPAQAREDHLRIQSVPGIYKIRIERRSPEGELILLRFQFKIDE